MTTKNNLTKCRQKEKHIHMQNTSIQYVTIKSKNLPENFNGTFVVEESYYETDGKSHASPHLFLISENNEGIVPSSYDIPNGEDKNTFSYDSMKAVDYSELNESKKFTPDFIARRMVSGKAAVQVSFHQL